MSPSSVSCGLRATWWLLDKFESHWIRWCIVLLLYAEWTTAFYRFSDVCRLSLTRYVNQIRADEVLNWVFCRWNFALCIFRQKTNQNESCLKVKVNRILKVKLMLVCFLQQHLKPPWEPEEDQRSKSAAAPSLITYLRSDLISASLSGHFISCERRK